LKAGRNLPRTKKLEIGDLVVASPGLLACAPGWHRDDVGVIVRIEKDNRHESYQLAYIAVKGKIREVYIDDIMHVNERMCQLP